MPSSATSQSLTPQQRAKEALERASQILAQRIALRTQPASAFTGEVTISLHIQGAQLNHILEREEDAEFEEQPSAPSGSAVAESRPYRNTLGLAINALRERLDAAFLDQFHGEISLCVPIVNGECQRCRCSMKRVHRPSRSDHVT